jgi:hypothetical protein
LTEQETYRRLQQHLDRYGTLGAAGALGRRLLGLKV